eukprot:GHVU01212737.1.p1 GENE.GHVU01212737.1~~GHVU01212737.1.p1  ORF type:complete len:212 (-),score=18.70 GHVU01212737.1:640-1275(-)
MKRAYTVRCRRSGFASEFSEEKERVRWVPPVPPLLLVLVAASAVALVEHGAFCRSATVPAFLPPFASPGYRGDGSTRRQGAAAHAPPQQVGRWRSPFGRHWDEGGDSGGVNSHRRCSPASAARAHYSGSRHLQRPTAGRTKTEPALRTNAHSVPSSLLRPPASNPAAAPTAPRAATAALSAAVNDCRETGAAAAQTDAHRTVLVSGVCRPA